MIGKLYQKRCVRVALGEGGEEEGPRRMWVGWTHRRTFMVQRLGRSGMRSARDRDMGA